MSSDVELSRQQVGRALRNFIAIFVVWSVHDASIVPALPIMAGYALAVGLTESQIAFLGGMLGLTGLWAVVGANLTRTVRNKRLLCVVLGSVAIMATPALILVTLLVPLQYRFLAICGLMSWLFVLGWTISPILGSWQANVIPDKGRGPFLGRRLFLPTVASMIYLFLAGKWLDQFPESSPSGFFLLFAVAAVAGIGGYVVLARTPYPSTPVAEDAGQAGAWTAPWSDASFRRLVLFYGTSTIAPQLAGVFFSVYMIEVLKLSFTHIAIYVNMAYVFMLVGYWIGGNFSQRFGSRPVIQVFTSLYCLVPIAWALATPTTYHLLIPLAYVMGGLSLSAIFVANSVLLFKIVPAGRDNTHYFALWMAVAAAGAALGPFLGAGLRSILPELSLQLFGLAIGPIQIIFAVAAVLWLIPFILSWRLIEEGAAQPVYLLGQLRGNLFGFVWNTVLYSVAANERTRAAAIHRLGQTHSPLAFDRLMQALDDVSPDVRSEAAWGLGEGRAEEAVPSLVSHLRDESSDIRAEAARALGRIGTGPGLEALIQALHDRQPHVRSSAAQALGEINTPQAQAALLTALHGEFDRATFPSLIDGASRSGDLQLVPLALQYLPRFSSSVLRLQVINTVCRLLREKNHFYRLFAADEYQRAQMMEALARRVKRLFKNAEDLPRKALANILAPVDAIQQAIKNDDWLTLNQQAEIVAQVVAKLPGVHPVARSAAEAVQLYSQQVSPGKPSDEGAIFYIISLVSMARMIAGDTRE